MTGFTLGDAKERHDLMDQLGIAWMNMLSDREGCDSKNESNALLMNLSETHISVSLQRIKMNLKARTIRGIGWSATAQIAQLLMQIAILAIFSEITCI